MLASKLPADSASPTPAPVRPRIGLWLAAMLTGGWILILACLTWFTANPPLVNETQVQHADYILVGRWVNRAKGQFEVTQELKQGKPLGLVTVTGIPQTGTPTTENWIIPVTKLGESYAVTNGQVEKLLPDPDANAKSVKLTIHVAPQCYPASDAVFQQLDRLQAQVPRN